MRDKAYREPLFDAGLIFDGLGIDSRLGNVLEVGCGTESFLQGPTSAAAEDELAE